MKGRPVEILYTYQQKPDKEFNWIIQDNIIPDPDQVDAIEAGIAGLRGVLKAPTGFGKTAVLAKRLVAAFGVPTLFVANKKSLLDDAAEEFSTGIKGLDEVAEIKDGKFGNIHLYKDSEDVVELNAPVVVATIQSLSARLKDERTGDTLKNWLNNTCKLVIVDECQAVGTPLWDEVLNQCHAPLRLFLSATPQRTDGGKIKIHAQSGPVLFNTSAERQIEAGRLCELDIIYKVFDHKMFNQDDKGIEYADAYREWIVYNEERNVECIVKPTLEMIEEERLVLILYRLIEHGDIIRTELIRHGVDADDIRVIHGSTADEARRSAVNEFKKGKFKVLIGSTIFDAGVNIPAISGIVLAGAGNSDITLIQRIGRGARNVDLEKELGYIPEFLKGESQKISKIYDIVDANVKFFTRQAWNRHKIAQEEFGKSRVRVMGQWSKKTPTKRNTEVVSGLDAQLELLNDFRVDNPDKKETEKKVSDFFAGFM